ncbi:HD domain-containing protein [Shewanella phaeophyticola]|uniref:HD domain-containing protein n=1 Tax=Shewanella phaeophyticola TaxID=2978345 RepID=A0ABT2P5P0_9GAMM|nr:HD domain-containing protein [Shewanella sp. KJ10-1]MCT8986695.1 HD domain-containing protein [Shewanella sp. KJ10-1]
MIEMYETHFIGFINAEMQQDLAHDLNHVSRVVNTAKTLCLSESADLAVVIPAAYLHDCFSFAKNHPDRAQSSIYAADKAIAFLESINYPTQFLPAIHHAIVAHSFSANVAPQSVEAKVVQDADRLDALGAIGIARCLQVSTSLGVSLYHLDDPFCINRQANDRLFAIDHFFTKLFKLADTMHTESAKIEASKRIKYMKSFLAQLSTEI